MNSMQRTEYLIFIIPPSPLLKNPLLHNNFLIFFILYSLDILSSSPNATADEKINNYNQKVNNRKQDVLHHLLLKAVTKDKEYSKIVKKLIDKKHFGDILNGDQLQILEDELKNDPIKKSQFVDQFKKHTSKTAGDLVVKLMNVLFDEKYKLTLSWSTIKGLESINIITNLVADKFSISEGEVSQKMSQHLRSARHKDKVNVKNISLLQNCFLKFEH